MSEKKDVTVCVVLPTHLSFQVGGAQYQVEQLVRRLSMLEGVRVVYLARRLDPGFRPEGYLLDRIPPGAPRWVTKGRNLLDAWRLYGKLRQHRPDVIYQRVGGADTGIAALYARRHGCGFVWHIAHDHDVTPGKLAHGVANIPFLHRTEKGLLEHGLRSADTIVAQTEEQRRLLATHYGREAVVIPNFHPAPTEIPDRSGQRRVLWVANFKRWKRPEAFIALAERLRHLADVEFTMIGKPATDREWQAALESRIRTVPNLRYLGQVTQDEVNRQLARSHLFVNTSDVEGFANTFVQAWLRQVPVVSLAVDPDGLLAREGLGLLCRSEEELARGVEELLAREDLRAEMGRRAEAYAAANHSLANIDRIIGILLRPAPPDRAARTPA